jgi:hypothetical protein
VSDRFTRDPRQPPQRPDDSELALRVREQMRTAVSNVRAGASAGADRSAEHGREPVGDDADATPGRVDVHPLY